LSIALVLLFESHATSFPVLPENIPGHGLLAYHQDVSLKIAIFRVISASLKFLGLLEFLGLFGGLAVSVGVLPTDLGLSGVSVEVSPCLGALSFPGFWMPQSVLRQTDSTYSED
jgi:hypothetical protein